MKCNECRKEIPDWVGDSDELQGWCLDCSCLCPSCNKILPEMVLGCHGGSCMNCAIHGFDSKQVIWEILFDLSRALNPLEGWDFTVHQFALMLFDKLEQIFGEGIWKKLMIEYDIPTEFEGKGLE